jgi:nucleotide-binding universal stress UspA family protein
MEDTMSIKDILLHLDTTAASTGRLDLTAQLAQRLGARVTGLFVADVAYPSFGGDLGGGAAMAEAIAAMVADVQGEGEKLKPLFEERLRRDGISGEWRLIEGFTARAVATHGLYADLVVVGQPSPDGPETSGEALVEAALFETGRPVLLTPYAGKFETIGTRVLIGWNASPQAARAVHDAIPLLAKASAVTVLVINHSDDGTHGEEPGADIAQHLARHGLNVTVRRVASGGLAAGDVLLNEAAEANADLIVMGGYGHSRLREMVLGGATRTLLRQMTAPVLMSH